MQQPPEQPVFVFTFLQALGMFCAALTSGCFGMWQPCKTGDPDEAGTALDRLGLRPIVYDSGWQATLLSEVMLITGTAFVPIIACMFEASAKLRIECVMGNGT